MSDPLSEIVRLLHPEAVFANMISGKGNWAVRYSKFGLPSFCIMLEGSCRLAVDGHEPTTISAPPDSRRCGTAAAAEWTAPK